MGLTVGCAVLASGQGLRFGQNKLLYPLAGRPLIEGALDAAPPDMPRLAVTRWPEVARLCRARGFEVILHDKSDLADCVALAAERALDWDGAFFLVSDQPLMRRETLLLMREIFEKDPRRIVRPACMGVPGNPILFPRRLLGALCRLPPGKGGGFVAARHRDLWTLVETDAAQLTDIDTVEDLRAVEKLLAQRKEQSMFTPKKPPMADTVCVATVFNGIDGPMLRDLLEGAGIPSLTRPKYGLDPLPVLAGSSALGEEIYVDAAQAEEARAIIAAFTGGGYREEDGQV